MSKRTVILLVIITSLFGALFYIRLSSVSRAENSFGGAHFVLSSAKWYEQDPGKAMVKPSEGMKYITVGFMLKNSSSAVQWAAPAVQSYVENAGQRYGLQMVDSAQPFQAGELAVGESRYGELSFLIPKDVSNPQFCYALNGDGSTATCISPAMAN